MRPAFGRAGGEEARARRVVLGGGGADGARPGEQLVAVETVVGDGRERVEVFAAAHDLGGVALEDEARVVAVEVFDEELGAPLEGAHDAVRVARGVPAFLRLD